MGGRRQPVKRSPEAQGSHELINAALMHFGQILSRHDCSFILVAKTADGQLGFAADVSRKQELLDRIDRLRAAVVSNELVDIPMDD